MDKKSRSHSGQFIERFQNSFTNNLRGIEGEQIQLDFRCFPASKEVSAIAKAINWPIIIENHSYTADHCSVSESISSFFPRNSIYAGGHQFPVSIIESRFLANVRPSIESVIVPSSITSISDHWFTPDDLCMVVFEANSILKTIAPDSFSGCSKL
jgi:hypothetical protein